MKPKNKYQANIVYLSSKLPKITEKQKQWAKHNHPAMLGFFSRNRITCLECNHKWKPGTALDYLLDSEVCPSCGRTIKLVKECSHKADRTYYGITAIKNEYQVIRIINLHKSFSKANPPRYWFEEVMQHWIDPSGNITSLLKLTNNMSYDADNFCPGSKLEIRSESHRNRQIVNIVPWLDYPRKRVLPIFKRNGFNGSFHDIPYQFLLSYLVKHPVAETLLKANQIELLQHGIYHGMETVKTNWPSIRICIRNNYIVSKPDLWFDYIDLLRYFQKDLLNAKYVCPGNLSYAHDLLVAKKAKIDAAARRAQTLKEQIKEQKKYEKEKKKFFGLQFSEGDITIKPLKSVIEFFDEGEYFRHCLYTNSYYKKKNSLIMSAYLKEVPLENIEISLSKLNIIQSRGRFNKPTEHHNLIVNLVQSNLPAIAKCI